jgi:hypothetical protein
MPCLQRRHGAAEQRAERVAIALDNGVGDGRLRCEHRAQLKSGAALIIDRGGDAVMLQLELLRGCEAGQFALLQDLERAEDCAGDRDGERNGEDQARRNGSKLEHKTFPEVATAAGKLSDNV